MESLTVLISDDVTQYLEDLVLILRDEGYFNFIEEAELYVFDIFAAIPIAIQSQPHKLSPTSLTKFGDLYVTYNSSGRTTWYIFFSVYGGRAIVEFVTNNHSPDAASFNID